MNLAALVEYDGTRFKGFQRQAPGKGPTVQGELEAAATQIADAPVVLEAAGRTDSGVHATGQVVSFSTEARHLPQTWRRALNALLPHDIAVRAVCSVGDEFHARKSALARRYCYRLFYDTVRTPLRERYAWRVAGRLDVAAMRQAAETLLGEHDFGAFGSSPRDHRATGYRGHTVRRMIEATCFESSQADEIECLFAADAFLTGMVRWLVGTLVLVGDGRLSVADFRAILEAREKAHPGVPAPAQGLCLIGVDYPAGTVSWEAS